MLGEADAKFPGQEGGGAPPLPSAVNPGQVYPKSSPHGKSSIIASHDLPLTILIAAPKGSIPGSGTQPGTSCVIGNPYLFEDALQRVENSLDHVIQIIESEQKASGGADQATDILEKFESWKDELRAIRADRSPGYPERPRSGASGGLFND
ncbi:hypothetical protein EDD15DRAFT_2197989 [Pisolithus albus]|nr:hypothetical protein EDD15DRAFT_2197989 [Pisolithus albus]